MLYAILCYDHEEVVGAWSQEHDDQVMERLSAVQQKLAAEGRLGPVARLEGTKAAKTLRKGGPQALVVDGPFAETKEQLLGFYVVDCPTIEAAADFARELAIANPSKGSYEIRPVNIFRPGTARAAAE